MKQEDIASLLLVIGLSLFVSFFAARALLGSSSTRETQVPIIRPIEAGIAEPSKKIYNDASINPTELIKIGDTQTNTPFIENDEN